MGGRTTVVGSSKVAGMSQIRIVEVTIAGVATMTEPKKKIQGSAKEAYREASTKAKPVALVDIICQVTRQRSWNGSSPGQ